LFSACSRASSTCSLVPLFLCVFLISWVGFMDLFGLSWVGQLVGWLVVGYCVGGSVHLFVCWLVCVLVGQLPT
jgi:hypothetical protein